MARLMAAVHMDIRRPRGAQVRVRVKCMAEASSLATKTKWRLIWATLPTTRWCLSAMATQPALMGPLVMAAKAEACMT